MTQKTGYFFLFFPRETHCIRYGFSRIFFVKKSPKGRDLENQARKNMAFGLKSTHMRWKLSAQVLLSNPRDAKTIKKKKQNKTRHKMDVFHDSPTTFPGHTVVLSNHRLPKRYVHALTRCFIHFTPTRSRHPPRVHVYRRAYSRATHSRRRATQYYTANSRQLYSILSSPLSCSHPSRNFRVITNKLFHHGFQQNRQIRP